MEGTDSKCVDVGDYQESGRYIGESDVVSQLQLSSRSKLRHVRPGPPKTTTGASPTYFMPWRVSHFGF